MDEITNPINACETPEGFTKEEISGVGKCLICNATKTTINWTRHFNKFGGTGPFHVQNYKSGKLNKWTVTLTEAVELARK